MLNLGAPADILHTQCSLHLGEREEPNEQKRWCWMNWSPASESHEEAVVPDANGVTQQEEQTGEAASAHRQATAAAENGAGRRWGHT